MSSCLLPQNDDPLPEPPPVKNQPPRIIIEQVKPQRVIEVNVGANCMPPQPSVLVEDPDIADLIRVKWVVYLFDGTKASTQVDDPAPIQGGSQPVRPRIEAPKKLFTDGALMMTTGKSQRLEVIVADGEFITMGAEVTTLSPLVTLPDGGQIPNPTYIDRYAWIVNTVSTPCP